MAASYSYASAWEANDVRYDFHSNTLSRKDEYIDTNGLRGTRARSVERNLDNIYRVNGQVRMFPTPTELRTLLPLCNGTAETGAGPYTYPLAETITGYTHVVDKVGKVFTYAGVLVSKYRIHGAQGNEAIGLDLDLLGTTESEGAAGSFASTAIDIATKPWYYAQSALTIAGSSFTPQNWSISVDHHIDADRFFNSQTLSTGTNAMDRTIDFECVLPYGDSVAAYLTHSAATGVAVIVTLTNGVYILTLSMVKVALKHMGVEINDRRELMLRVGGAAMKSSSTLELVTTLAVS